MLGARSLLLSIVLAALAVPSAVTHGDEAAGERDTFSSPMLSQGHSFTKNFTFLEEHPYHCHPHPSMKGRVVVTPAAPEGNRTVEIRAFRFVPERIEVRQGFSVTWTNADSTPHTVTHTDPDEDHSAHSTPGLGAIVALFAGLGGLLFARLARQRP